MSHFYLSKEGTIFYALSENPQQNPSLSELVVKDPSLEGKEKHVPVLYLNGDKLEVSVGSTPHPMLEAHHIEWIMLITDKGTQLKRLKANEEPKASFLLEKDEKILEVYSYCNIHGLWKANI